MKGSSVIHVIGAKEHNLKNISLQLPHHQFIVITGVSGSGKSSLLFDTLYIEGHRRYIESLESNYVKQFLQTQERPDVEQIFGLPAVIGIHQGNKSNRSLRSTVGTATEIYALFRLLFARIGQAYSHLSGQRMVYQNFDQMQLHLKKKYGQQPLQIFSPLVQRRKGHYQPLFSQLKKKGFEKVRVNGTLYNLQNTPTLDRYKNHNIELFITKLSSHQAGFSHQLRRAFEYGKNKLLVLDEANRATYYSLDLVDPSTGLSYTIPSPNTFSFNTEIGACPTCKGTGEVVAIDEKLLIAQPKKSLKTGAIPLLAKYKHHPIIWSHIEQVLAKYQLSSLTAFSELPDEVKSQLLRGEGPDFSLPDLPTTSLLGFFYDRYKLGKLNELENLLYQAICPSCKGSRLKKEASYFFIQKKSIDQLASIDLIKLQAWMKKLPTKLNQRELLIAKETIKEICRRIETLIEIGLGYLYLNRPLHTLSGGEIQRIRLGTQIGTQLVGVLYILDEPSIGLHAKDNEKIIYALKRLRDLGNTVIVIEHDKETMLAADYLVEIGPAAGKRGGEVVAAALPKEFTKKAITTSDYLTGRKKIELPKKRRKGNGAHLTLKGCRGYNLKNVDLQIPLGLMVGISGVSGSGKSTLIEKTLLPALKKRLALKTAPPLPYQALLGAEHIDKVIAIDQTPIGRTPRSNPATYTDLFSAIRSFYAQLPEAKARGYGIGRFSFNVRGGRCETCKGAGLKLVEMDFLPSIRVLCEDCQGKRYNRETCSVKYKSHSISDILEMTVEQASQFFSTHPKVMRKLKALLDVGLDYITLGQHATTFSGGEAQRIKLAAELSAKNTGKTLYVLNEPSTGLHFSDIELLLKALQRLVDQGNTVLIIEHNLDILKTADHIIDLGPEGAVAGGQIVAAGSPEKIVQEAANQSYTAQFLKKELLLK